MILKKLKLRVKPKHITNCYIILDENTKEAMIVDPAAEPEKIIDMIKLLEAKVKYIVLTHCHYDHIMALLETKRELGGKIIVSRLESENINNRDINLVDNGDMYLNNIDVDARVDDNDIIHIGDLSFRVITTPGHTNGSLCLYSEDHKFLISGDTLFNGTWGRTDLPTSSFEDIITSISNKLMILPEDTIVYPGHGNSTIIKEEAKIYLNLKPKMY